MSNWYGRWREGTCAVLQTQVLRRSPPTSDGADRTVLCLAYTSRRCSLWRSLCGGESSIDDEARESSIVRRFTLFSVFVWDVRTLSFWKNSLRFISVKFNKVIEKEAQYKSNRSFFSWEWKSILLAILKFPFCSKKKICALVMIWTVTQSPSRTR